MEKSNLCPPDRVDSTGSKPSNGGRSQERPPHLTVLHVACRGGYSGGQRFPQLFELYGGQQAAAAVGFREPRRPHPLQGLGVQQPGLRLQHKNPQRRRVPERADSQRLHVLAPLQIAEDGGFGESPRFPKLRPARPRAARVVLVSLGCDIKARAAPLIRLRAGRLAKAGLASLERGRPAGGAALASGAPSR